MAEDNTDELANPVTDSAGSKPDKISSRKPRPLSNGHKLLPCYHNSSTSSYDGNTRRLSTGKLDSPDKGQDVLPHYLRASTGSCHDFCKYGREHSFEAKSRYPLSKRTNTPPAVEQSSKWTIVVEAKKGAAVKQNPSTTAGIIRGEGKKVTGIEEKASTSPGNMLGAAKKGIVVKQKPSTSSGSTLGKGKKAPVVEQKLSTPTGSILGEAKKGVMVKQKPSTTPRSTLGEGKTTVVEQMLSTPPEGKLGAGKVVTMIDQEPFTPLESVVGEGKKVTLVEQKPSSPSESMSGEGKEVTGVDQKPSSPLGNMLGEEKEVTLVEPKPSAPPESMLGETVVEQKPSPPVGIAGQQKNETLVGPEPSAGPESMSGEIVVEQKFATPLEGIVEDQKNVTLVNQKPSTAMLEQGKKVNVVNKKPSSKVHSLEPSLEHDSSSDKLQNAEKKMKYVLAKHYPPGQIKLKMVKSSSKTSRGLDGGDRKVTDVNPRKRIIISKVSVEKSLKIPTISCSPRSSSVKPLILRVRSNKSLKVLTPLKDQTRKHRDGTNKVNPKKVPEKTLHVMKVDVKKKILDPAQGSSINPSVPMPSTSSVKSSTQLRSPSFSNEEKKGVVMSAVEAEAVGKSQKKTLKKGKAGVSEDYNPSVVKLKFRRGKVVDLQQENNSPRRLMFRWGRRSGESQDGKRDTRRRIFKKKGVDGDNSSTILNPGKVVLRHQDVQERKDAKGLLNNVIEETASKLVESKKSKVKALVGAFETVISLQDKPSTVTVS